MKKLLRPMPGMDLPFLILVLTLVGFGLVMLASASSAVALYRRGDAWAYLRPQLLYAALGLCGMGLASRVDYHIFHKLAWPVLGLSLVMLTAVLFMPEYNGCKRWLVIPGLGTLQPSEIAKFAVVLVFAHIIALNHDRMKDFSVGVLPFALVLGVVAALMLLEPHLSGTVLILGIGAVLMFVGGTGLRWFLLAGAGGIGAVAPNEKQLSYMQETLTDIIQTLKSGNETQIKEKIDVPSFVKYYLLNEYIKTYDFSVTSVFFYYKGAKLYAGPPWDYDLSMGNTNGEYAGRCSDANSPQGVFADKNLFIYLAHKDWFKDLVKLEYESHYDYFSQLHTDGGVLDTLRSTYSETINRNYTEAGWSASKWWINIQRQPDRTYEENYSFLKNWLYERNLWFEDYLEPFVREYLIGDADGNGVINIEDVTSIQRILAGLERNPNAEIRGNVVNDMLSIVDVTEIQKYIANYENIYSIGDKTKAKFEMCY